MFGGIVAELLAVSELRLRQAVHAPARLRHFDDGRHVVGVAIDRDAALDGGQRHAFRLQVAVVGAEERGELCTGGVAHDEQPVRVAAVLGNVLCTQAIDLATSRTMSPCRRPAAAGSSSRRTACPRW